MGTRTTSSNPPLTPEPSIVPSAVLPSALKLPIYTKLSNKRIVLASSSSRRLQILQSVGINPEVIPSSFDEDLNHEDFDDTEEPSAKGIRYAAATATEKAVDVYRRLVEKNPEYAPDLVIGADTIVQTYIPSTGLAAKILEKPATKAEHIRMLSDLASMDQDGRIEVVSAVVLVYPCLESPGYRIKQFAEVSRVWFGDVGKEELTAYVDCGEGIDRAGGFAIQGIGCQLIRRIDGDWNNVVGFPIYAFLQFMKSLVVEDGDFLAD